MLGLLLPSHCPQMARWADREVFGTQRMSQRAGHVLRTGHEFYILRSYVCMCVCMYVLHTGHTLSIQHTICKAHITHRVHLHIGHMPHSGHIGHIIHSMHVIYGMHHTQDIHYIQ